MKIENDLQADATQRWIERVDKHISNLSQLITPATTEDSKIVAQRLKESLQASLITYSEERNYGSTSQQSKEETEGRVPGSGIVLGVGLYIPVTQMLTFAKCPSAFTSSDRDAFKHIIKFSPLLQ